MPNHNIIYLIEGDVNRINKFTDKTDKLTIFSAIFSLNYYKGFSVIRTMNIEETALFICNSANKIRKCDGENKKAYYSPRLVKPDQSQNDNKEANSDENSLDQSCVKVDDYVNVIKKVKKENITPQNIDEIMLCQIPGISSTTAVAIIHEFKSIYNLTKQLEEKGTECLQNITYVTTKNQTRKINKTSLANLAKFLLKV
jgi:ERCC4-type nuclease